MFKILCVLIVAVSSVCLVLSQVIQELPYCQEKTTGTILVSTLDGNLSALNFTGGLIWEVPTGPGPLLVSNIHNLELTKNGEFIRIIPSLSGTLYKFDGMTLDPIPITAESLLRASLKYSDDLVIAGGYEVRTYGVGFESGKVFYECSHQKCSRDPSTSSEDVLLIERKTQTIRAIEPKTGHERWNFSVGLHNIRLPDVSCMNSVKALNLNITVNMPDGILHASGKDLNWQYKFHSPIVSVWKWDGKDMTEINVFAPKNVPSIISPTFSPAVYIAMHKKQLYIHESVIMQNILHGKKTTDIVVVESNGVAKIPWKPIAVNDLKDEDSLTALSVLNSSPYVEGNGYYLYTEQDIKQRNTLHCENNNSKPRISGDINTNDKVITNFFFSWWKELILMLLTIITVHLIFMFRSTKPKSQEIVYVPVERRISERESESEGFKSRYTSDFDTIQCLGKGGFGVVFEVRQKIDECSYAIKRITLPDDEKSKDRVMREVKALAKLEHKHIVRYFNSWLEHPPVGWKEEHDKIYIGDITGFVSTYKTNTSTEHNTTISRKKSASISIEIPTHEQSLNFSLNNTSADDSFIVFESVSKNDTKAHSTQDDSLISNTTQSSGIESLTGHQVKKINWRRPGRQHHSLDSDSLYNIIDPPTFLYIQMQLCQKQSLKEWLIDKQTRDYDQSLKIFSQILSAVEYVHMRGLIHRDLKPSNIFFALDGQIKVGDFGLVKDMEDNFEAETKKNQSSFTHGHTKEVGTQLYMSPEQFQSRSYDYKVDIYSLGLIFFELIEPFSTDMERLQTLSKVKNGQFPGNFETKYPDVYAILKEMLCDDPKRRLTTIGISSKPPFNKKSTYGEEYYYCLPSLHKS